MEQNRWEHLSLGWLLSSASLWSLAALCNLILTFAREPGLFRWLAGIGAACATVVAVGNWSRVSYALRMRRRQEADGKEVEQ